MLKYGFIYWVEHRLDSTVSHFDRLQNKDEFLLATSGTQDPYNAPFIF